MPDLDHRRATDDDLELQVERLTESLSQRDGISASREVIERAVRECLLEWQDAPVRDYVAILAERSIRARLRGEPRPAPVTSPA